jgi:hypothetical protein
MKSDENIMENTPSQRPRLASAEETEKVHQRMTDDGEGKWIIYDDMEYSSEQIDDYKIVFFLYQRGYTKEKYYPTIPITCFLNNADEAKARDALLSIIDKKGTMSTSKPAASLDVWKHWQRVLLRYSDLPNVTSFFQQRNTSNSNVVLMIRRHDNKNCFIHATLSAVAYMAALDSDKPLHEAAAMSSSLDNDQVVRHIFDPPMLYDLLCGGGGGSAYNLLHTLLLPTKNAAAEFVGTLKFAEVYCADRPVVVTGFIVDGPILECYNNDATMTRCNNGEILQFDMNGKNEETVVKVALPPLSSVAAARLKEMENAITATIPDLSASNEKSNNIISLTMSSLSTATFTFDDSHDSDSDGKLHDVAMQLPVEGTSSDETHALLIIGYRKDDSGKLWFLIQNTWHGMILFEMSAACLEWHVKRKKGAGGGILFIEKLDEEKFTLPETLAPLATRDALVVDGGIDGWAMPFKFDVLDGIEESQVVAHQFPSRRFDIEVSSQQVLIARTQTCLGATSTTTFTRYLCFTGNCRLRGCSTERDRDVLVPPLHSDLGVVSNSKLGKSGFRVAMRQVQVAVATQNVAHRPPRWWILLNVYEDCLTMFAICPPLSTGLSQIWNGSNSLVT